MWLEGLLLITIIYIGATQLELGNAHEFGHKRSIIVTHTISFRYDLPTTVDAMMVF